MTHKLERIVRLKIIEAFNRLDDWSISEERIIREDGLWVMLVDGDLAVGNGDHEVPQLFIELDLDLRTAWNKVNSFTPSIPRKRTILNNLGIKDEDVI